MGRKWSVVDSRKSLQQSNSTHSFVRGTDFQGAEWNRNFRIRDLSGFAGFDYSVTDPVVPWINEYLFDRAEILRL